MTVAALLGAFVLVAQAPDLGQPLAGAVDMDTETARREAALALAERKDVTMAQWLAAARSFGAFEVVEPGVHRDEAELQVGDARERTELFVFVPRAYDPARPAPLLFAAHGAGGEGKAALAPWQGVAEALGMLVLAPTDSGANAGYAFSKRERQAALAALRWARRHFNVDENRVFAAGASRGGHLVWDLALRFPDRFAALAPMIGGPRFNLTGGQNNLRYLENAAHLPIRDLQGSKDDPGLVFNVRWAFERLKELGARDAQLLEFEALGHDFDLGAVDWPRFFGAAARAPGRERVVRLGAAPGEGRAFWVDLLAWKAPVAEDVRPRVSGATWDRLDDAGRRKLVQAQVDERTARLDVVRRGPGRFTARGRHVARFRLLLSEDMLGPKGLVDVEFDGKKKRVAGSANARTLLLEFVERFDRTFLPLAEVVVP